MIFYLVPPRVAIDLRNFNKSCISRLDFFCHNADYVNSEGVVEIVIPGTELDKVGHFILRCFCLNQPAVTDYIVRMETGLFLYRLKELNPLEIRKSCANTLRDISQLDAYREINPLTSCKEKPYFGSIILSSLRYILHALKERKKCEHFKYECNDHCQRYFIEIPFQACLNLVKSHQVELRRGNCYIPCSKWTNLLEELFVHHFNFGLTMISNFLIRNINEDPRWQMAFQKLYDMYSGCIYKKPIANRSRVSFNQVDSERRHFPPCMSHLLNVLRTSHRLSHIWRYNFSLFLKDIGLTLQDSIEFWKHEYTKSCSAGTSCTHSWQQNERKYRYSIRHMYGLEGAKVARKSKTCEKIQNMQIGMRDEGGCPFAHFDDINLISTLNENVRRNENVVGKIIELKNSHKPCEACSLHMITSILADNNLCDDLDFESPMEYYLRKKTCNRQKLHDW